MSTSEIRLALYEDRPGSIFESGNEKALYEIAVGMRAEIAQLRTNLDTRNRQVFDLDSKLAERDRQIAELLAAEPILDDDQPGVPA